MRTTIARSKAATGGALQELVWASTKSGLEINEEKLRETREKVMPRHQLGIIISQFVPALST